MISIMGNIPRTDDSASQRDASTRIPKYKPRNTQNTRKMECQSSIFHTPKSDAWRPMKSSTISCISWWENGFLALSILSSILLWALSLFSWLRNLLSHDVHVNAFARYFNAFRILPVCAILCALTSCLSAADPVVSNISAVQRAGTKLVDLIEGVMPTLLS